MQRLKRIQILTILLATSILLSSCKYDSLQESSVDVTDSKVSANLAVDSIELTGQENTLMGNVGFEKEIFQLLKANFSSPITELEPDYHDDSIGKGVSIEVMDTGVAYGMVESLSDIFMGKGYCIFIYDLQYDDNPYKIGILKSNDKYDSLKFMLTNGTNYDLDTNDVIGKLKEWDSLYKISLVCVGSDFVEIKLNESPKDIGKFAKDVYQFCPDSVDQGVGSLKVFSATGKCNKMQSKSVTPLSG